MAYPERIAGEVGVYERWDADRHTEAFAELCADAEVMRFLGGAQSQAASAEVSRSIADHWATFGFGLWACVDGDGRCWGFSGACRPGPQWDTFADEVEIGWRLDRRAWGRGFATEGARLALAHLGRDRVIAFVDPGNHRSRAVAQRLGMTRASGAVDRRLRREIDVFALSLPRAEAAA